MNSKSGSERMDKESSSSMMITTTTKTTITEEITMITTIRTIMIIITIKTITIISRKKTKELVNKISNLIKKSLARFTKIMMRILSQSNMITAMMFWLLSITMEASRTSRISSIFILADSLMANPAPLSKAVINSSRMFNRVNSSSMVIILSSSNRRATPNLTFSTLEVHNKRKMTNACQTSVW
jgi:hypothetical protein